MRLTTGQTMAALAVFGLTAAASVQCAPSEFGATVRTPASPASAADRPAEPDPATVHTVTAGDLGASWHKGCPVSPDQLRRVDIDHVGFDGRRHRGALVVHRDVVDAVVTVFEQLYRQGFPIEKMRTPEHYPNADDEESMRDNNTSAFSCRTIPGSGKWAKHAYGRAVDVNPLLNPLVNRRGGFEPTNAAAYLNRGQVRPGLIRDGDSTVRAFTDRGWRWGGHWHSPIDYQHFELP